MSDPDVETLQHQIDDLREQLIDLQHLVNELHDDIMELRNSQ